MKQLIDRIAAPLAAFAAALSVTRPVAAAGCDNAAYNLLPGDISFMQLEDRICETLGAGVSTMVVTLFNAMALAVVFYLGYKLVVIGVSALAAFNGSEKVKDKESGLMVSATVNEGNIIRGAVLSIVQVLLVGVIGFLAIVSSPNLLFGAANGVLGSFSADNSRFDWLNFAGVFKGLAVLAQNVLSIGVILYGAFLVSKAWLGYLGDSGYAQSSAAGMKMDNLRNAVIRTGSIALVTLLAFIAITFGPNLFGGLIFTIAEQINIVP